MNTNSDLFQILKKRGFVQQITDEKIADMLKNKKVTCYVGYDPTGYSLHVGNMLSIMALAWFQKFGHKPITIVGGATALIGDPSGKTEMRKMLTIDTIKHNITGIKENLSRLINFGETGSDAIMLNNADWLYEKKYIDFLRDIGQHFSVNRMLTMDSVKLRLEKGLSFIEFNYMILQAYDFMYLNKNYGCELEMGGDDQWGNIVAGIDLTRRINQKEVYGLTFPLLTTSSGQKMGKTEAGAVWLDANMTKPYDFYQFWINSDDRDVKRFLYLYTFLPEDEVEKLGALQGAELREAKKVLAFEVTKLVHGANEAEKAVKATEATFGHVIDTNNLDENLCTKIAKSEIDTGLNIIDVLIKTELTNSKSEARRSIEQGGVYLNDNRIDSIEYKLSSNDIGSESLIRLRLGKKKHHIIKVI